MTDCLVDVLGEYIKELRGQLTPWCSERQLPEEWSMIKSLQVESVVFEWDRLESLMIQAWATAMTRACFYFITWVLFLTLKCH